MDPLTHALASYALKRAAFPRVRRPVTFAILIAGTAADLDALSGYFGPSAYLAFFRTYFHSFMAALLISLAVTLPFFIFKPKDEAEPISRVTIVLAAFVAASLHLAMDLCQSAGVELLWPFSARRLALDCVALADLWILGILLAAILVPMLSGLVTEEIGARSKGPRGRIGASLSFLSLILYILARFVFHGNAIAALQSRAYRGELPRKVAAFAESGTMLRWRGVVETERALHEVEVPARPGAEFDPSSARSSYKPEPSLALDAAIKSSIARRFLSVARFPKASVEQIPGGYHVVLRDFPFDYDSGPVSRVQVVIDTDPSAKILSEELDWVSSARNF